MSRWPERICDLRKSFNFINLNSIKLKGKTPRGLSLLITNNSTWVGYQDIISFSAIHSVTTSFLIKLSGTFFVVVD